MVKLNATELRAEILRKGLSIPRLAELMNISKKRLYSRINGDSSFTQSEITLIADILDLNGKRILDIFFGEKVS